ncbi:hypothetical protein SSX86_029992 [Deinandra increscens subsp. villosa]|uniref:Uncharacterized protein n=1 Tax=Deinandra increscens subsp. villosa TaxID=3103831 RepID=A0AAP0CAN3_9ASTR
MKINMVYKIYLLTLVLVASLVSSSFAGAYIIFSTINVLTFLLYNNLYEHMYESLYLEEDDQISKRDDIIHERLLRANTKDYGRSDPAPTFVKPPFKLIPN